MVMISSHGKVGDTASLSVHTSLMDGSSESIRSSNRATRRFAMMCYHKMEGPTLRRMLAVSAGYDASSLCLRVRACMTICV